MNDERLLPQSPESELAVLSHILQGNEEPIEGLCSDHFFSIVNRTIFNCIKSMFDAGEKIDLITVNSKIKDLGLTDDIGGAYYLSKASIYPCVHLPTTYIDILEKNRRLRKVIQLSSQALESALDNGDADLILKELEKQFFNLHSTGTSECQTDKACSEVLLNIDSKISGDKVLGLQTDIGPWDSLLGGLLKSRFYVLAARAGRGKTSMIEQMIGSLLLKGNPVLIFEKDMSPEMLIARMACRMARVPFFKFDLGSCSRNDLFQIQACVKELSATPLKIYSPSKLTASDLRTIVKREKRLNGVKAVFLDHVLNLDVGREGYREGLTMASSQIRASVQESELPHVILAQLNREADKVGGRPNPSHIKEFDALYADCDVMAMLWADKDPSECSPGELYPVNFTVNKNRYGPQFEQELGFDRAFMKFKTLV